MKQLLIEWIIRIFAVVGCGFMLYEFIMVLGDFSRGL
jgi:hypothetical protein